jgi:hypothetical protein
MLCRDVDQFMGPRLPNQVYMYLIQGLVAPQVDHDIQ